MNDKAIIMEVKIKPLIFYERDNNENFHWKLSPVLITGFGNIPLPSPCYEYSIRNSKPQKCGTLVSIDMRFLNKESEYSYEELIEGAIEALKQHLKERKEKC